MLKETSVNYCQVTLNCIWAQLWLWGIFNLKKTLVLVKPYAKQRKVILKSVTSQCEVYVQSKSLTVHVQWTQNQEAQLMSWVDSSHWSEWAAIFTFEIQFSYYIHGKNSRRGGKCRLKLSTNGGLICHFYFLWLGLPDHKHTNAHTHTHTGY